MAVNLQTILESIRQKASGLAARCESLARASEEQEKRISDLTAENRALKEQVEQLKEYLGCPCTYYTSFQ